MNSRTHSTTVAAWHADVFAYLSHSANIPEWAPGFARDVRVDGDDVLVTNDDGERRVRVQLNEEFGIVDFLAVRADGLRLSSTIRIVATGAHATEVLFTLFRIPGEDDENFAERAEVIPGELAFVQRRLATAAR